MPAKRKAPAKTSAKTPAKTAAKKSSAKGKPSARKSTAKPKPATELPAPGEEVPPPAPEGQLPTEAAPTTPAAVAAATGMPTPGAPGVTPPTRRRNGLLIPFIIVLVLWLLTLVSLGWALFIRPETTTLTTGLPTTVPKGPNSAGSPSAAGKAGTTSEGTCSSVSHPEDKAGALDNKTRHGGDDNNPDLLTSNPPTSGIHGGGFASNGKNYSAPQPLGYLIHSMDHGSVIIWHNGLSDSEVDALLDVANGELRKDFGALVMVPKPDMQARIALTAWGSLMECDGVNAQAMSGFIEQYMATGPEAAAACFDMPENHPRCQ